MNKLVVRWAEIVSSARKDNRQTNLEVGYGVLQVLLGEGDEIGSDAEALELVPLLLQQVRELLLRFVEVVPREERRLQLRHPHRQPAKRAQVLKCTTDLCNDTGHNL